MCSQIDFLRAVPSRIQILGVRFLLVVTFVIPNVQLSHVGTFVNFSVRVLMNINQISLLRLLPDDLWDCESFVKVVSGLSIGAPE